MRPDWAEQTAVPVMHSYDVKCDIELSSSFRHIVRIAGTDLDGSKELGIGLMEIRGVGLNLAKAVAQAVGLGFDARIGELNDDQIRRLESALEDLGSQRIPNWMLNRQKDLETGRDLHLIGSDLLLTVKSDVDRMKRIRSWKGVRHSLGLKVRGQRTKTTGRTGKSIGVRKKRQASR